MFTEEWTDGGSPEPLRGTGLCLGICPDMHYVQTGTELITGNPGEPLHLNASMLLPPPTVQGIPPVSLGQDSTTGLSAPAVSLLCSVMLGQGTASCISVLYPFWTPSGAPTVDFEGDLRAGERGLAPSYLWTRSTRKAT